MKYLLVLFALSCGPTDDKPKTNPWERIDDYSARLEIPGGWVVRYAQFRHGAHMVLVQDLKHEWEIR